MATHTISPQQQVDNLREALWQREYELEHKGIPAREIMNLVYSALRLHVLEEQVARGEVQPLTYHECDEACAADCPDFEV